ncbi:MAG TPA: UDP-glucose 4-epimerase GalE [Bryobacteraceae bacterium]|jgi:UDP-glucose 4-epimerase|nr:UDP-glucose 4-epimerase GalE [Bryobacteraceae bacterium]
MPNVLVTGGAGYIGSVTAHLLKRRGYGVAIVDDLSRGYQHNIQGLPFHQLNLLETGALAALLNSERVDAVVHFAAHSMVGESTRKPELYFLNNDGGSASLFSAMIQANVKRLVFSSTAAVYGTPQAVPIPEDLPFDPVNPYGESKVLVEKMLKWLDSCSGLRSIALRYFNACGADPESGLGEEHQPETHLIPLLIEAVLSGEPMTIFGDDYQTPDGTCIRDYIHVTDLAEAHVAAIEKLLAGGASEVFNVGTGAGHSVLEVLRAVEQVSGRKVPHKIGPRRAGDPPVLVANSEKLKRALGWKPKFPEIKDIVATAWRFQTRRTAPTASS